MTEHRPLPNCAIYARDQALENAMEAVSHLLAAQEIVGKVAETSTNIEVVRMTTIIVRELGKALANNGNIVVHMQNLGG